MTSKQKNIKYIAIGLAIFIIAMIIFTMLKLYLGILSLMRFLDLMKNNEEIDNLKDNLKTFIITEYQYSEINKIDNEVKELTEI